MDLEGFVKLVIIRAFKQFRCTIFFIDMMRRSDFKLAKSV